MDAEVRASLTCLNETQPDSSALCSLRERFSSPKEVLAVQLGLRSLVICACGKACLFNAD